MEPPKKIMTNAERCKAYRERKISGIAVSKPPPKTRAEIKKAYRERQKMKRPPKIKKTRAEIQKAYKDRKREKELALKRQIQDVPENSTMASCGMFNMFKAIFMMTEREYSVACVIYKAYICTDNAENLWYKATDMARMLGHGNSKQVIQNYVKNENKLEWATLKSQNPTIEAPMNWHPMTMMINKMGLYDLGLHSHTPEGRQFRDWILKESLESIGKADTLQRRMDILSAELKYAKDQLICKDKLLVILKEELKCKYEIIKSQAPLLAVMDAPENKLHIFAVFKRDDMYKFLRVQKRSFQRALEQVEGFQMVIYCENMTNAINFLNHLKKKFDLDMLAECLYNTITVIDMDIVLLLRQIFDEYNGLHPIYYKSGELCPVYRDEMGHMVANDITCP